MEKTIEIKNLTVSYGKSIVLDNLNLKIANGEFIVIIGKSGTGKTTLLNSLAGFIKYQGEIKASDRLGFCFQNHSLFYWMTVAENIDFGLSGMSLSEKKNIVDGIIRKIGLSGSSKKYPDELSGGERQRVALGRAIANNPEVLLLDEPFSSLDIYTRDQMMEWLLKLISDLQVSVLMVTHYLDEALFLADRIFVLKDKSISNETIVPFVKPRTQAIRYSSEFQKSKEELVKLLNH